MSPHVHRLPCLLLPAAVIALAACGRGSTTPQDDPVTQARPTPTERIAFEPQEPYASRYLDVEAGLGFDQPTTQPARAEPHARVRAAYTGPTEPGRLALEVYATSSTRHRDDERPRGPGPLADAAEIQVFAGDDRAAPLAAGTRAQLAYATALHASFQYDGKGPVLSTLERIRLPLGAQAPTLLGAPYELTVVVLDAQGRTMAVVEVEGDVSEEPIEPVAEPEGGWTAAPLAANAATDRPTSGGRHGSAGKAVPRAPRGPRFAVSDLRAKLPESIPGWTPVITPGGDPRIDRDASGRAEARHRRGDVELTLCLADAGDDPAVPAATAPAARHATGAGHLAITGLGDRLVEQRTDDSSGRATATVRLANGVVAWTGGRNQDLPLLVEALAAVDLGAIEGMARP